MEFTRKYMQTRMYTKGTFSACILVLPKIHIALLTRLDFYSRKLTRVTLPLY